MHAVCGRAGLHAQVRQLAPIGWVLICHSRSPCASCWISGIFRVGEVLRRLGGHGNSRGLRGRARGVVWGGFVVQGLGF